MNTASVKRIGIIGSGGMAVGIAAHAINLGFEVRLLAESDPVHIPEKIRSKLFIVERAGNVQVGEYPQDLPRLADCDWIIDATADDFEKKRALYRALDLVKRSDTVVSCTSGGLQLTSLVSDCSEGFRTKFLGTHFVQPVTDRLLVEVIPCPQTDTHVVSTLRSFLESRFGRRVVIAKDIPGFISHRFGVPTLIRAIRMGEKLQLSVEDVEWLTGPFLGVSHGAYTAADAMGLDTLLDLAMLFPEREISPIPTTLLTLVERGWWGDKAGQGLFRREGRDVLPLEFQTLVYRNWRGVTIPNADSWLAMDLDSRLVAAATDRGEVGQFYNEFLLPSLRQAQAIQAEVSNSAIDFDDAIEWSMGSSIRPIATSLQINREPSYETVLPAPEFLPLREYPRIWDSGEVSARDLGDGVVAISIESKNGLLTPLVVDDFHRALDTYEAQRLVITGTDQAFSAGLNLRWLLETLEVGAYDQVSQLLERIQLVGERLERTRSVAAVTGFAVGGGLEWAFSCPIVAADARAKIGLPESRLGLIPAGRGTTLMRQYNQVNAKRLCEVVTSVIEGTIATSADRARQLGLIRPTDFTVYHPHRLISEAKRLALDVEPRLALGWKAIDGPLTGMIDREVAVRVKKGELTTYDELVAGHLRQIVAKATSYEDALAREREAFLDLASRTMTQSRVRHRLEKKQALRN